MCAKKKGDGVEAEHVCLDASDEAVRPTESETGGSAVWVAFRERRVMCGDPGDDVVVPERVLVRQPEHASGLGEP